MHLTFNLTSLIFISEKKDLLFPFSIILCLMFFRLGTIFFTFTSHETLPSMLHIKSYLFYESFRITPAESNLFHFQTSYNTCGCIVNLSLTIYCILWQVRSFFMTQMSNDMSLLNSSPHQAYCYQENSIHQVHCAGSLLHKKDRSTQPNYIFNWICLS